MRPKRNEEKGEMKLILKYVTLENTIIGKEILQC